MRRRHHTFQFSVFSFQFLFLSPFVPFLSPLAPKVLPNKYRQFRAKNRYFLRGGVKSLPENNRKSVLQITIFVLYLRYIYRCEYTFL